MWRLHIFSASVYLVEAYSPFLGGNRYAHVTNRTCRYMVMPVCASCIPACAELGFLLGFYAPKCPSIMYWNMEGSNEGNREMGKQRYWLLCTKIWKEVRKGIEKWESKDIGHFEGTTSKKSQNKEKRVLSNYKVILIIPKLWLIYNYNQLPSQ